MPKVNFRENGRYKTTKKLTEGEQYERNLYNRWIKSKEYENLKEYEGRDIGEVPEEYREKIAKLRSYGLGLKEKNTYEEIIEFFEKNGRLPRSQFSENGKVKTTEEMTEDELYERKI